MHRSYEHAFHCLNMSCLLIMDEHDEFLDTLMIEYACDQFLMSLPYDTFTTLGYKAWFARWMIRSYAMMYVGWCAMLNARCMLECVSIE